MRGQFHHVNDIAATIYDLINIQPPAVRRGLEQIPVSGTSLAYTFADAGAPTRKEIQYFEMAGHRGLWHDGWKAVTRHEPGVPFDDDTWELYHTDADPSECNDLAASMPEKLEEMIALWWQEAETHGVLPLDERMLELFAVRFRDCSPHPVDKTYRYYPPVSPMGSQSAVPVGGRSWNLTASVTCAAGSGGGGVVVLVVLAMVVGTVVTGCCLPPGLRTPVSLSSWTTGIWCSTTTPSTTTPSFARVLLSVRGITSSVSNSTEGHPEPRRPGC